MNEYNFCPKCGGKTEQKLHNLLICKVCGYNFYINPAPTSAVILENSKGEILLVKRKFEPKKGMLDLPGGFIEPGESIEVATRREIKEELGIEISDLSYFVSYPDYYFYQGMNIKTLGITYIAKIKDEAIIIPSDDVEDARFFNKKDLPLEKIAFENIKQALIDYIQKKA